MMTNNALLQTLENSILEANTVEFETTLNLLLKSSSIEDVSLALSILIKNQYTRFKADYLSAFLEIALNSNFNLATVKHPENLLFKLTVITGSVDLYNCYIDAFESKFLAFEVPEDHEDYYMELYGNTVNWTDDFFQEYTECVKGMNYNGAIGISEDNEHVVFINREDYEQLEDVTSKYNTIIGRRDIIKDLYRRAGFV